MLVRLCLLACFTFFMAVPALAQNDPPPEMMTGDGPHGPEVVLGPPEGVEPPEDMPPMPEDPEAAHEMGIEIFFGVMSGDDGIDPYAAGQTPTRLRAALTGQLARPRLAFLRGPTWAEMEPGCAARYEKLADRLGAVPRDMCAEFVDIVDAHQTVMFAEIGHNMWPLMLRAGPLLSEMMRERLVKGRSIGADDYLQMRARIYAMRMKFADVMADFDAAITAPAPGEAPLGLESTGSRLQTLAWTTLGVPAVNVPGMTGPNGLPLGVQMVGRRGDDATVLRAAAWLGQSLVDI